MALEAGTLLNDRYRIQDELGSGGMGAVYRAHDANLDFEVAVKENFFVSEHAARQFHREAALLYRLKHPALPRVIDHFILPDQGQYLVMDYVQGEDTRQILEKRDAPLETAEVMRWAKEILEALEYLHSRKPPIIHRDVKPANIKITPAGRAVLVDFGLAKELDPAKSTTVGAKAFTPGFAPPEQYGTARTDARTDLYSLGATLYNLLSNTVPPDGLRRAMGTERLVPLQELNPVVPAAVAEPIERAMQTKPERRFESAAAFARALFAGRTAVAIPSPPAGEEPTLPPDSDPEAPSRARPSLVPLVLGGLLLVAIGAVAGLLLSGSIGGARPPDGAAAVGRTASPAPGQAGGAAVAPSPTPTEQSTATTAPTEPSTSEPTEAPPPTAIPTPTPTPRGGGSGQIGFVSERFGLPQILVMEVDGSEITQLTRLPEGACQPEWSPAGDRLLFVSPCRQKQDSYPGSAIFVMNIDGSEVIRLISRPGGVFDPDWSELGIAYTSLEEGPATIWLADADGRNAEKLTQGRARDSQPSTAPGGDRLVVMNTSRAGSPTLFWVFHDGSFNGSNPDHVTREQVASQPAWSPAGDLIAYVVDVHIWVIRWDGRGFGAVQLTTQGPNDGPSWSPDASWIAFETWRDAANHDIYIMTANGGQPTRLTTHLARDYQPTWRP